MSIKSDGPPASTPRLYVDQPLDLASEQVVDGAAAHYLANVMRLKIGDPVLLFDNISGEWLTTAKMIGKKSISFVVERQMREIESVPDLWICFAPIKKVRMDWVIEKACELGASHLQPVVTERTIIDKIKPDRLTAQIIEACEQCGRTSLPSLGAPVKLPALLRDWPQERRLLFADENGGVPMPQSQAPPPAALLVGPEGGFTQKERELLNAHSAVKAISLGPRILRAETAAISGMALWMGQYGDWDVARTS